MADFLQNLKTEKQRAEAEARRQAEEARQQVREQQAAIEQQARQQRIKLRAEQAKATKEAAEKLEKARKRRNLPFKRTGEIKEAESGVSQARTSQIQPLKEVSVSESELKSQIKDALKTIDEQEATAIKDIGKWAKDEEDKFRAENIYIEPKKYPVGVPGEGETVAVGQPSIPLGTLSVRAPGSKGHGAYNLETVGGWVSKEWYDSLTPEIQDQLKRRGIDNFNAWVKSGGTAKAPWGYNLIAEKYDPYAYLYQGVGVEGIPVDQPLLPVRNERTVKLWSEIGKAPTVVLESPNISEVKVPKNAVVAVIDGIEFDEKEFKASFERHGGAWWKKTDWAKMSTDEKNIVNEFGPDGLKREQAKLYTTLSDGNKIRNSDLAAMPDKMKQDVVKNGLKALEVIENGKPIWQFKQLQDWGIIDKDAKFGGVDENGDFVLKQEDLIDYITSDIEGNLKTPEARKAFYEGLQERGIGTPEFWENVGIGMIPVAGTVYFWKTMKPWAKGVSVATDVLTFIPFLSVWSAAAKAASVPGRSMAKATMIGLGRALTAEVKAPVTAIIHPIETIKTMFSPVETALRPKKIPLSALERRPHTVKIPYQEIGDAATAKQARDILFDLQAKGLGPKIVIDGKEIELTTTVLNTTGIPTAAHTCNDIRPFLYGTELTDDLYLSPTVHTNFSLKNLLGPLQKQLRAAEKAGDTAKITKIQSKIAQMEESMKGAMPGVILIRDEEVLSKVFPSNQIYRGTVEIEKILKKGSIKLPPVDQILVTRDISGRKLYIGVIGEKIPPAQIAKMKFLGAAETIKDIFRPAYKIKGGTLTKFDELLNFGDEYRQLEKELEIARKAGKADDVIKLEAEMEALDTRARDLARAIDREAAGRSSIRSLFISRGDFIDTETYREIARRDPERLAQFIRGLTSRNQQRVINNLEPNQRPQIRAEIQRLESSRPRTETTRARTTVTTRARGTATTRALTTPRDTGRVTSRVSRVTTPRVTRGTVRTPPRTPIEELPPPKPPIIPSLKLPQSEEELTKEQREGAVTWRQGIFYIVIYPPYGDKNRFYTKIKPKQVREAKGVKSAYRSIARFIGPIRKNIEFDMGIVDVTVKPNKEEDTPVLEFKPDKEQMRKPHKKHRKTTVKKKQPVLSRVK